VITLALFPVVLRRKRGKGQLLYPAG
jgi:type 1 glutamine amidotransferase